MSDEQETRQEKQMPLLSIAHCDMIFQKSGGLLADRHIHVLRDINLDIFPGEILALVGESGCGKTTLGKIITRLYRPTSGEIWINGERVNNFFGDKSSTKNIVQFVQQDSYAALNPVRTIYQSLYAPIKAHHKKWKRAEINAKIDELMGLINLKPPEQFLSKFPHQLSGGQRQRILMARAISLDPKLVVTDEPVSMIDVSLRLSVLNMMKGLNKALGISFVYITHDLSTARYIADSGRVAVMYLGEIVEIGKIRDVIKTPRHPYTRALIEAVPVPDPKLRKNRPLPLKSMQLGSLEHRSEACAFYDRCLYSCAKCLQKVEYANTETAEVLCCNLENVPNTPIYE